MNLSKFQSTKPNLLKGLTLSALLAAGGCASQSPTEAAVEDSAADTTSIALEDREARIASLERELRSRETRISDLEGRLSSASASASATMASASDELFPPNAKPGECYARVLHPEQYRTSEERVLVREASQRFEVIPAEYTTDTERVLVKEASTRLEVIPATYKTVEERVLVKPASKRVVEVPATYKTVTETVLDKPAHTVWKKGRPESVGGTVLSESVNATGELMCLVEVPATYKTVERRVIDTAAATREIEIPAEYKTVTRTVVDTPATTREVTVPAQYDTVEVTKLVSEAGSRRIEIPAEYRTITKREKTSDARMEWQQVLCEINATRDNVRALQAALERKGYDVGPIDGILGAGTINAVNQFAKTLGVPQGANYVPVEVLKELDITL